MLEVVVRKSFVQKNNETPSVEEDFEISWEPHPDYEFYTLKVVNKETEQTYLHRMNITAIGGGLDLVKEQKKHDAGTYEVQLYGQDTKLSKFNERKLKLLEDLTVQLQGLDQDLTVSPSDLLAPLPMDTNMANSLSYGRAPITRGKSPVARGTRGSPTRRSPRIAGRQRSSPKEIQTESPRPVRKSPTTTRTQRSPSPGLGRGSPRRSEVITHDLADRDSKYCSCILQVAGKQSEKCLINKAWGQSVDGKSCYNPYAICSRVSPGRKCAANYNFDAMTDSELIAFALLHNKEVPKRKADGGLTAHSRKTLMTTIKK